MLFTDSPYFTTTSDLEIIAPYLMEDLNPDENGDTTISIQNTQTLAANQLASTINSLQIAFSGSRVLSSVNGVSPNHTAGLGMFSNSSFTKYNNSPRLRLSQIVVTSEYPNILSPLQYLHAYLTLELMYEELAHQIVAQTDRFQSRRDFYHNQIDQVYMPNFRSVGIPWVPISFPCPGAIMEPNSGIWGEGNLSTFTGQGSSGATGYDPIYIAITYVDQTQNSYYVSYRQDNNAESGPSTIQSIVVAPNQLASVSIASLVPPNGDLPLYGPSSAYCLTQNTATGWNIYAGVSASALYLQNSTPIPITSLSANLPAVLATQLPMKRGQIKVNNSPVPDFTIFRS